MYLSGNDAIICVVSADIPCKNLPAAINVSDYLKCALWLSKIYSNPSTGF